VWSRGTAQELLNAPAMKTSTSPLLPVLVFRDSSGIQKTFPLRPKPEAEWLIGSSERCDLQIQSLAFPAQGLRIWVKSENPAPVFWCERIHPLESEVRCLRVGGIAVNAFELSEGLPFFWGEIEFRLLQENLLPSRKRAESDWTLTLGSGVPLELPTGATPWLTQSASGKSLLQETRITALSALSVYVQGETGSGKELIANLLHHWSPRRSHPFVALNCGALPVQLAESELFGHKKGAFTGADQARSGAIQQAHQGTLFLDEIADLSLELQVKLLRFLESGEIRPLGADRSHRVNVRVVCASHRPLSELVREGSFRQDLYYRLAPITLRIPPLRDRPADIDLLARHFAQSLGAALSHEALRTLMSHSWPGNVRELRHCIERAFAYTRRPGRREASTVLLSEADFAFLQDDECMTSSNTLWGAADGSATPSGFRTGIAPPGSLQNLERRALIRALRLARGNRAEAAKILGVSRSTVFVMIKRHGVQLKYGVVGWDGTAPSSSRGSPDEKNRVTAPS